MGPSSNKALGKTRLRGGSGRWRVLVVSTIIAVFWNIHVSTTHLTISISATGGGYHDEAPQHSKNKAASILSRFDENQRSSEDNFLALKLHEGGHWEHNYPASLLLNNKTSNSNKDNMTASLLYPSENNNIIHDKQHYFPREIEWMTGKNWPDKWDDCALMAKENNEHGVPMMYGSGLGNQCGVCGVTDFQPSFSNWVPANDINDTMLSSSAHRAIQQQSQHHNNMVTMSPSLKLIKRLAKSNSTLCFAGDSIDLQFYAALNHNLVRQKSLQNEINISISSNTIPVNFSDIGLLPYHKYWMTMDKIMETRVSLKYINNDDNTDKKSNNKEEQHTAKFRFIKTYGWAPWNTLFMEECNIVSLNLGLHYNSHGDMREDHYEKAKYLDDFRAAITYLVDFVSSQSNRIAVWRSTLPQHFNTSDGHFQNGKHCSMKQMKQQKSSVIQKYNMAAEIGFSKFCPNNTSILQSLNNSSLNHLEHNIMSCTVNQTSTDYRTVYKMLIDNNYTEESAIMKRFNTEKPIKTGRILQWNIADIFDVPQWHASNDDCSHFCFVPPLYEAAFERLELLLPPLG